MKIIPIINLKRQTLFLLFAIGIAVILFSVVSAQADRSVKRIHKSENQRIALVIGNSAYKQLPLKNPVNDAGDIAAALEKNGFQVNLLRNGDKRQMEDAIRAFGKRLYGGGVGLFYFAGHGIQYRGRNYLVPVKARIEDESDVEYEAVDAGKVLGKMELAGNDVNIVILDACRNNPFSRSFRSIKQGLAQMDAPTGSFLAYATSPGSVAADGKGRNGVYTKYILKYMGQPKQSINQLFMKVRRDVLQDTGQKQTPWESSSLTGDFYFSSDGAAIDMPSPGYAKSRLEVKANVDGARIFLNGKMVGITPFSGVPVSSGEGHVSVEKSGYQPYRKQVQFEPDRTLSLYVNIIPTKPLTGRLFVDTDPSSATVKIMNIGPLFYQGMKLVAGDYQVQVSAAGHEKKTVWVALKSDEDKRIDIRLEPLRRAARHKNSNSLGMRFVYIKPGTFMMGSPRSENAHSNDERLHKVTLTHGYYMQTTEVTQGQWKALMGSNPSQAKNCGDDCPVENVSWIDIQKFIRKLNGKEGTSKYRLPTEAEWEYSARAGTRTPFAFGSCLSASHANFDGRHPLSGCPKGTSRRSLMKVASFKPNAWGFHDMHGNVWEWCQDSFADPKVSSKDRVHVMRGGSLYSPARACRSANRNGAMAFVSNPVTGFRLARSR